MKILAKYFFITLVVIQAIFVGLWYMNMNLFGLVSWIGEGETYNPIKLFLPLIVFGGIKIVYWLAEPLSELYTIILRWVLVVGIVYFVYWLFFI